jgi:hypothetical protein
VVSASNALRTCLPALHVWDALLDRAVTLEFHEDNSTAVTAMKHGYSPAMRYLERTHGVCLRWCAERFTEDQCHLFYERTALMAADIYTKAFTTPSEWDHALRLINHFEPERFWGGRPIGPHEINSEHMGSLHKGGIVFDYWVHNPWHGRLSLDVPAPEVQIVPAVACITPRVKDRVDDDDDFNDQSGDDCEEEDYANTPSDEDSGDEYDPQPTPPPRHRRIVEFCTSNDSRIGKMAPPNCEVVRLTIDDDLTSDEGLAKALAAVSDPSFQVLLFGALPCTGGSQWQNYNWKRGPDTQDKIRGHWESSRSCSATSWWLLPRVGKTMATLPWNGRAHVHIGQDQVCSTSYA